MHGIRIILINTCVIDTKCKNSRIGNVACLFCDIVSERALQFRRSSISDMATKYEDERLNRKPSLGSMYLYALFAHRIKYN